MGGAAARSLSPRCSLRGKGKHLCPSSVAHVGGPGLGTFVSGNKWLDQVLGFLLKIIGHGSTAEWRARLLYTQKVLPGWPRAPLSVLSPSPKAQSPRPARTSRPFLEGLPAGASRPGLVGTETRVQKGLAVALTPSPSERQGPGVEQST